MPRTIHLIDALPYVFRAWFSLPETLTDPEGRPVNAVLGFANFLIRYVDDEDPSHVALCFDQALASSFRNELYPDYKGDREEADEDLRWQIDTCRDLAEALGFATFVDDRYEADDLIATLCRQLTGGGHEALVVTNDKDLTQLVADGVVFYDYARGQVLRRQGVHERFGVWPEQIPDYLGLAGDSVDCIPGVRGVGAKTAVALLEAFGDMDTLYASLDEVAGLSLRGARTLGAKLEDERDMAFLSRTLATLAYDAPLKPGLRGLTFRGADAAALDPLLDELGFGGVRDRVTRWA